MTAPFLLGLLVGAGAFAALLIPRLRTATEAARAAREAEKAARLQAARETEHAARLSAERGSAHQQQLADLRAATEEKIALVAGNREQLAEQMRAISADALGQVSGQLEKLATAQREADRATAVGELGKRSEEIKQAVDPIARNLTRLSDEVARLEQDRRTTHGQVRQMFEAMTAEVGRLRDQTGTLVSALKRPQVRGAWGEMQLRNCVAAANMTEHVDFLAQASVTGSDGGRLRPDLVVHLPAERDVVVDAKVPMDAYLRALETTDEAEQQELLRQHGRQTRQHIDTLASKSYHAQFASSPEFVVMFIPNEGVYCAALEAEPTLQEHGAAKGVLIATPTTLIALLHATYYGWRQEKIAESAREIAAAGRELHKRIATFLEPYAKLGRQLNSAVNAYNQGAGSLEARVLPQLRTLEEAGAGSEKPLPPLAGLETPARLIVAPELPEPQPTGLVAAVKLWLPDPTSTVSPPGTTTVPVTFGGISTSRWSSSPSRRQALVIGPRTDR
jgi:DNA recombination protein RmuC